MSASVVFWLAVRSSTYQFSKRNYTPMGYISHQPLDDWNSIGIAYPMPHLKSYAAYQQRGFATSPSKRGEAGVFNH